MHCHVMYGVLLCPYIFLQNCRMNFHKLLNLIIIFDFFLDIFRCLNLCRFYLFVVFFFLGFAIPLLLEEY